MILECDFYWVVRYLDLPRAGPEVHATHQQQSRQHRGQRWLVPDREQDRAILSGAGVMVGELLLRPGLSGFFESLPVTGSSLGLRSWQCVQPPKLRCYEAFTRLLSTLRICCMFISCSLLYRVLCASMLPSRAFCHRAPSSQRAAAGRARQCFK